MSLGDGSSEESLTSLTDDDQPTLRNLEDNDDDDEQQYQYHQPDNDHDFIPFSARGVAPDELQATHINHYHDLSRVTAESRDFSITRPSQFWLAQNGLIANGLTLKELLTKGKVSLPTSDKTGRAIQHITFDSLIINDFECRLHTTIETLSNRIRWLLQDSRKVFGVVQGARVLVILDFSQGQASFGRGDEYHKHLMQLIEEQLIYKEQLGFIAYGTDVDALWNGVRDVNTRALDELRAWIASLKSSFGCSDDNCTHIDSTCPNNDSKCAFKTNSSSNLLKALRRVSLMSNFDTLLLVVGSLPDQNIDVIADYLSQLFCGQDVPRIHAVSYDCSHHLVNALLKTVTASASAFASLASARNRTEPASNALVPHNPLNALQNLANDIPEIVKHTYHCYSHDEPRQIYNSTDIRLLVREIQRAYELLSHINEMRHGALGSALVSIENELNLEMSRYPQSKFLPRPPNHEAPLHFAQNLIDQSSIIYARQQRGLSNTTSGRPPSARSQGKTSNVRFNDTVSIAGRSAASSHKSATSSLKNVGIYLLISGIPDQSLQVCCAYVEECNVGKSIYLHTILFNIDDYYLSEHGIQSNLSMASNGRWANATKTAEFMRALAKHSGGRFLWFRETGIIESDDIKLLQNEIEKACQFSEQAANLVEMIKSKRRVRESINLNQKSIPIEQIDKNSGPLVVRQTVLSAARQNIFNSNSSTEEQHWRPTSTNNNRRLIPQWPDDKIHQDAVNSRRKRETSLKQESFYLDSQNNSKFSIIKTDALNTSTARNKSIRKYSPGSLLLIPTNDENDTSQAWLRKYSLIRLKLDLHKMVSGPECRHDTITVPNIKLTSSARYCSVFPSINIKGSIRHLQLRPRELDDYRQRSESVLRRYFKRMQWLLNGSRLIFSTIVHKRILLLVDTSGSMESYIEYLKKELATLVWEQLFANQVEFNFIQFNDNYQMWRENLVLPTEDNCHEAVAWISTLKANGNTCSEHVLKFAFDFHHSKQPIDGIYYISDGKPDHSTSYLLEQVRLMNTNQSNTTDTRRISINTVSFCCQDIDANNFLKSLAHDNNGRYHRSTNNSREIHLFMHRLQQDKTYDLELDDSLLPELESDDIKRLLKEIVKARLYLKQAITFRSLYNQQQDSAKDTTTRGAGGSGGQQQNDSILVGPARVPMSEAFFNRKSTSLYT
ncbi:unnamed protein product [Rotaria socialis]|uniref:VWFA domain-containing protein n=1 Tax=Rotaria socialis TaxID=392032 RepID=A0A820GMC9_9BILA|nr:unnamed protein product [Rotaria socialis]